jgi:hypothetical protein
MIKAITHNNSKEIISIQNELKSISTKISEIEEPTEILSPL